MLLFATKKKLIIAAVLSICFLTGGWWLAVRYVNREYLTAALTEKVRQEAEDVLDRPVRISHLKLTMSGSIEAVGIKIGKLPREREDLLRAKRLVVRVSLWQAIKKRDLVSAISLVKLVGTRVWLGQDRSGAWNIAQFMGKEETKAPTAFQGKIAVEDGEIVVAAQKRPQEEISISSAQVSFAKMPQLALYANGSWEEFPLSIQGSYDLEREKSDLRGKTGEVSISGLLDALALRGYDLHWGEINGGRVKLNFRLWDSQLATAFNLFGAKAQFMIGGQVESGKWQPPGWHSPIRKLDGQFRWDTSSKELVLSGVEAQLRQAQAQGEGSIIFGGSPLFDVNVKVQGRIAEIFNVYPQWRPKGLEADGIAKADLAFRGTAQALRVTGSAELKAGRIFHPALGSPIEGIAGKVTMEPNKIACQKLQGRWQGGSFTVENGYMVSPWSVPRGAASVTLHSFEVPGSGGLVLQDGKAAVSFENKQLWCKELSAVTAGGQVTGSAFLDLRGSRPAWQAAMQAQRLDLSALEALGRKQFPQLSSLKGKVSGSFAAKGEGFRGQDIQASAQLALGAASVGEISFSGAEASLLWDGSHLLLPYLTLSQSGGKLSVAGKLDPAALSLSVTGQNLTLGPWTELFLPGEKIAGKINFLGQVHGTGKKPKVVGRAELVAGEIRGQKIQLAQGTLNFQDQVLSVSDFNLHSQGALHKLEGSITTGKQKTVNLTWQFQDEKLERVMALAGLKQPISGTAAGRIQLRGTLPKPSASGMVNIISGRVSKQEFARGSFFFQSQGDGLLLERASLEQNGSRLAAQGTIGTDGSLNLKIIAPRLNLASLTFIPQEQQTLLAGEVSFQGLVGGTLSRPEVIGELASAKLEYDDYVFENLAGRIKYAAGSVDLEAFKLQWLGAELVATGRMRELKNPELDLQLQITGIPLNQAVALAGWKDGQKILGGHLDGMAQLAGPVGALKGEGFFSLRGGKIGKLPLGGRGELVFSQGELQLQAVSLTQGKGTISAAGRITSSGMSLKVEGQELDLALISQLTGEKIPDLAGRFSLQAEIAGDYAGPKISAQLAAQNAKLGELKLGQIDARLQLNEGIVTVEKLQTRQNGGFLSLTGTLPLSFSEAKAFGMAKAAKAGSRTDLKLELNGIDLRLLAALNPNLKTLSGIVSAQLQLRGEIGKPELYGRVDVQDGAFSHPLLGGELENVKAGFIFYGDQLVVEELKGSLGHGSVQVTGGVKLQGIKPQSYDLALAASDVHYDDGQMLDAVLDGALRLKGSSGLPKVSGSVNLAGAKVKWTQKKAQGKAPFDLLLDVDVATRDQAAFSYGDMLDLWFEGGVHVGGSLNDLALSGKVNSRRGSFSYLEMSFLIDEATAEFFDYRGIMPTLQVQASSQVKQYTIHLSLSGPVENLAFSLSSTPELSQDEILALLGVKGRIDRLVGTTTGDADLEQVVQDEFLRFLDLQFRSQFVSGLERSVEEFLGLDEFRLEPNLFAKGEKMEIRLSKQLSERAIFSYERTLELTPNETFKLDWRILPSIQLKGQWNDRDGSALSLETKFSF